MSFGRMDTHTHAHTDVNDVVVVVGGGRENKTAAAGEHGSVRSVYMLQSDIPAGKALKKNEHQ